MPASEPLPTIEEGRYLFNGADRLGSGGMGDVYRGVDMKTGQRVAIKVIRDLPNADDAIRFRREARAAGKVGSKHIVEVRDFGVTRDGRALIVMELLDGETLERRFEREKILAPARVVAIARQLLETLILVHQNGIVHRDLKPANLFLERSFSSVGRDDAEFLKIIDFGASVFYGADGQRTRAGVIGTPCYMAPEQFFGEPVDQRSDLYAVGVILYRAISGRLPFQSESLATLAQQVAAGKAPPAGSGPLAQLIERAMKRNPDARFRDAREFLRALEACAITPSPVATVSANSVDLGKMVFSSQPLAEPRSAADASTSEARARRGAGLALPWRLFIALLLVSAFGFFTIWRLRGPRPNPIAVSVAAAPGSAFSAQQAPNPASLGSRAPQPPARSASLAPDTARSEDGISAAERSAGPRAVAPAASSGAAALSVAGSASPPTLSSSRSSASSPASKRSAAGATAQSPPAATSKEKPLRSYQPPGDIVDPWSAR